MLIVVSLAQAKHVNVSFLNCICLSAVAGNYPVNSKVLDWTAKQTRNPHKGVICRF